jgi:CDP-diacylglycerol--glycerol-3-phosphate 3-phosphatidyltransferase/cardiolipin synthase
MFRISLPNALSYIRILLSPILFYTIINGLILISIGILVLAGITDILDGFIARREGLSSSKGAYLDVTSDFILIMSCFLAFVAIGWYDLLILVLIVLMFILFIGTSGLKKPVYDPVGKYLGAYLMVMIFISLIFPESILRQILVIVLLIISICSIISRLMVFVRRNTKNQI